MKIFLCISMLFFSTGTILTAQNIELPTDYVRNSLSSNNNISERFEGSPYPEESFQNGTIEIGDKEFESLVRYNGLTDAFEIKNQAGEIITLLRRPDISIDINDLTYEIIDYKDENNNRRQGYFQILNDGNILLLKKQGVNKIDAVKAANSYGRDRPARLEQYEEYFIKVKDSPAKEVRLKKKNILKEIDNKEVKSFVKKNKLKLKDEAEVIQTLEFADSLKDN